MTRAGCYVSCCQDKLVSLGSYLTAAQYEEQRLTAVSASYLICDWQQITCAWL